MIYLCYSIRCFETSQSVVETRKTTVPVKTLLSCEDLIITKYPGTETST